MSREAIRTALIVVAVAAIPLVLQWQQNRKLEDRLADLEAAPAANARGVTPPILTHSMEIEQRIKALEEEVKEETAARKAAETALAKLKTSTAPLQGKVVVDFGKVEDLGKQTGSVLRSISELAALAAKPPSSLTPDEKRQLLELQREKAMMMGALPEITAFQDKPDEYGRFFGSALKQAAGLSDAEAANVENYMRERAVLMGQQRLNAANEPSAQAEEAVWEEKRDAFNTATVNGLKQVLPPGASDKIGLSDQWLEFLEMDFDKVVPPAP